MSEWNFSEKVICFKIFPIRVSLLDNNMFKLGHILQGRGLLFVGVLEVDFLPSLTAGLDCLLGDCCFSLFVVSVGPTEWERTVKVKKVLMNKI